MADIRIMRASGVAVPVGAQLFPGQLAVNEERLYVGLYNSTDEAAAAYAVAMLDKANAFLDNITIGTLAANKYLEVPGLNSGKVKIGANVGYNSPSVEITNGSNYGLIMTNYGIYPETTLNGNVGSATKEFEIGYFQKIYVSGAIVNDNQVVSKAWVLAQFAANDVMVFKGTIGTGGTPGSLPSSGYSAGWTYKVITAGTYAGFVCEVGDTIMCIKDYATGFLDSDWQAWQANIDGAVVGPASAVDGQIAIFNGTSGKLIKNNANIYYDNGASCLHAPNFAGIWDGTAISVAKGGTNIASYAIGDILYASAATVLSKLADVAAGNALLSGGVGAAPAWGKVSLTAHVSGTLPVANGGTGRGNYTAGDIIIGTGTTSIGILSDVASGFVLVSKGVGVAPAYEKVALGTHVSGSLPVANGGTGKTTITADAMWYASAAGVLAEVATTVFGRSLLAATSGVKFTNLYAARAELADTLTLASDVATATPLPLVFAPGAGNYAGKIAAGLTYTPSTGILAVTKVEALIDCGVWS